MEDGSYLEMAKICGNTTWASKVQTGSYFMAKQFAAERNKIVKVFLDRFILLSKRDRE